MKDSKKIFDGLLVLEFQNGKREAISLLVKRYQNDFYRYAYWYTKDGDMAQDIVQESWHIILKKLGTLKNPNSFKSWALRIITRKSQDYLSARGRKNKLNQNYRPPPERDKEAIEERQIQIEVLKRGFEKLSFDHQMVLRLFYTEESSLKEISSILNISVGTVKSRLFHAREKLKSILNK